jgi:hypothetical protein
MEKRGLRKWVFVSTLAVVLVGTGWYLSGRDFRTLQDGLSRRFRDRGQVAFSVIGNLSNDESDELMRQAPINDAKRSLKEAHGVVLTSEDSKVAAILDSYLAYEEYSHNAKSLAQESIENSEKRLSLVKEMSRLDTKRAQSALNQWKSEHEKEEQTWQQMLKSGSQAELESKNCEQAASKYFESSPSPSEGLNKLCPTPAVLK